MIVNEPYLPTITLQDILNFNPADEQTYTSSRLVNAVANILCETTTRETSVFAERLQLDMRHLTYAIELETGMTLKSLINEYRLAKVQEFMAQNPDVSATEVARLFGFSTPHALWRFFQIHTGQTPEGQKSTAPRLDNYHKMVKDIKEGRYTPKWKVQKQDESDNNK